MTYCKRCVYPIIAVNLDIDDDGVCSARDRTRVVA